MASTNENRHYVQVWVWLVVLLVASTAIVLLPIPPAIGVAIVFGAAVIKALLVAREYMHLRAEYWLVYALALLPTALVLTLGVALLPDIAAHLTSYSVSVYIAAIIPFTAATLAAVALLNRSQAPAE
jgi:cytochrome c oxidase subunit IV